MMLRGCYPASLLDWDSQWKLKFRFWLPSATCWTGMPLRHLANSTYQMMEFIHNPFENSLRVLAHLKKFEIYWILVFVFGLHDWRVSLWRHSLINTVYWIWINFTQTLFKSKIGSCFSKSSTERHPASRQRVLAECRWPSCTVGDEHMISAMSIRTNQTSLVSDFSIYLCDGFQNFSIYKLHE